MTILCVACRRLIQVPDERAANPRLKIKCGCGALFVIGEAQIAAHPTQGVSPAPRTPVEPSAPPRPATAPRPVSPAMAPPAAARPQPASPAPPPAARPVVPPPPVARPPEPARVSFQATSRVATPPRAVPQTAAWRRCANHPQVRSTTLCPQCLTGFCAECAHKVGVSVLCTKCEVICVETTVYEERQQRERQRARPMMDELSTIIGYPMRDPTAYVMLAVFTWVFAALGNLAVLYGKAVAVLFSQGVLMAYCFTALSRVSSGNLKEFMPDIGDITDLVRSLRLGVTALLAGSGPLLLVMVLIPGVALFGGFGQAAPPQEAAAPAVTTPPPPFEGGESEPVEVEPVSAAEAPGADAAAGLKLVGLALSAIVFGGIALVWKVVYTPVALTVAGISRSSLSTLNPLVGFDTIRRMGGTYWVAMAIYTVVAVVEWIVGFIFGYIPILGGIVRSFVDAYAWLMIGCTLGLAVFKKAPELGLE